MNKILENSKVNMIIPFSSKKTGAATPTDPIDYLTRKYPSAQISRMITYSRNTLYRIVDHDEKIYIVKSIQSKHGYASELDILRRLPEWWGLYVIDTFTINGSNWIIMNEIQRASWSSYDPIHAESIAKCLYTQISWLMENRIYHNDFGGGNILLRADKKTATIIDFESIKKNVEPLKLYYKYKQVLCKLPSNVRDILKILLKRNKVRDN